MSAANQSDASPYTHLAARVRDGKTAEAAEYEQRPPRLTIVYRGTSTGLRRLSLLHWLDVAASLAAVPFRIELDGAVVGQLSPGQTLHLETTAGEHRLRLRGRLANSSVRVLELANGQQLTFWCQSSLLGIILQRQH
jgi:hypothetical protein